MVEIGALTVAVIVAVVLVFNLAVDRYLERVSNRMEAAWKADKKRRARQSQS